MFGGIARTRAGWKLGRQMYQADLANSLDEQGHASRCRQADKIVARRDNKPGFSIMLVFQVALLGSLIGAGLIAVLVSLVRGFQYQ